MVRNKKRALFFSAGEQEMNMNAYEEYKTIIMAKSPFLVLLRLLGTTCYVVLCYNEF